MTAVADDIYARHTTTRGARLFGSAAGRRALKIVAGMALVGFGGWTGYHQLVITSSIDAVINARLTMVRAPIDGTVSFDAAAPLVPGTAVAVQAPVGSVADPRGADDSRLFELRRALVGVEADLQAATARVADLQQALGEANLQAEAYRAGRVRQIELRRAEATATAAAAAARHAEAAASAQRAAALHVRGHLSEAAIEKHRRDAEVARGDLAAAQKRTAGLGVELEAARSGTFLGDSYNDAPASLQRARDLTLRIAETTRTVEDLQRRRGWLEVAASEEQERLRALRDVALVVPVEGRVWEMLARPGEYVRRGQDLLAVLDCSTVAVTATVSERDFNTLRIGDPVRFRVAGSGREYADGRVARLGAGATAGSAAYAIAGDAKGREVIAVFPGLAASGSDDRCAVGRAGKAVFEPRDDERKGPVATAVAKIAQLIRRIA